MGLVFLIVASFFLIRANWPQIYQYLPYPQLLLEYQKDLEEFYRGIQISEKDISQYVDQDIQRMLQRRFAEAAKVGFDSNTRRMELLIWCFRFIVLCSITLGIHWLWSWICF